MLDLDQSGFLPAGPSLQKLPGQLDLSTFAAAGDESFALDEEVFLTPQQLLLSQGGVGELAQLDGRRPVSRSTIPCRDEALTRLTDLAPHMTTFQTDLFPAPDQASAPQPFMADPNAQPWNPISPRWVGGLGISLEAMFPPPDERRPSTPYSPYSSNAASPPAKPRTSSRSPVVGARVEKKKVEPAGKFVIMTPTSISA